MATTIKRDRKAEFNATQTVHNLRRWNAATIGESKVWDSLHRVGHRDGAEMAAIVNRCGAPEGAVDRAATDGRLAIEETIGRKLTESEAEAYALGFYGAAYQN